MKYVQKLFGAVTPPDWNKDMTIYELIYYDWKYNAKPSNDEKVVNKHLLFYGEKEGIEIALEKYCCLNTS